MHKRIHRQAVLGLAVIMATTVWTVTPAKADSPVQQAMVALDQIKEQSAKIDSDYAQAQAAYEDADRKLKQTDADIAAQEAKVGSLKDGLSQLALAQYQSNGFGMTASLLASPDEESFLNSLSTISTVTEQTNSKLQDVQVEQAKLDRLRADAAAQAEQKKAEQDKQAGLVAQFDAKERDAKAVVDRLKEDERAQVLAAQQEQSRAAEEAARRAAPRPTTVITRDEAPTSAPSTDASGSERARAAVEWAKNQIGKPYLLGSAGPDRFDCSGLTSGAYKSVGVALPRTSQTQFNVGTPVDRNDLQPGDLLFFYDGITHVGLYVGDGVMVHSSPSGHGVHYSNLATYPAYKGARRVA